MDLIHKKTSLMFDMEEKSYLDIIKRVSSIYGYLVEYDFLTNKVIAVYLDRDESTLYSIMAILATNSMYVPIDTILPNERIQLIIKHSNPDLVITNEKYKHLFTDIKAVVIEDLLEYKTNTIYSNKMGQGGAYVLFTSGTTGIPKGVQISKAALTNFIHGTFKEIDLTGCSRILCQTSVSFDIFHLESVFSLCIGLTVVLATNGEQKNPRKLARLIDGCNIDVIQMTPARLQQLLSFDKTLQCLQKIKVMIVGGEAFPLNLLSILQGIDGAKIYNAYGPTEATIWISYSCLNKKTEIDIGIPMINNKFYIVDEELQPVSVGETGEICISGENLADAYMNDKVLTDEKFPYLNNNQVRVFRTGDLGYLNENGDCICLGRADNQIKIHGFRVELEEIESYLVKHEKITNAVVTCIENHKQSSKNLVALYCGEDQLEAEHIKEWLCSLIPDYMIPNRFIWVPEFIYSIGGKVDRKAMKTVLHDLYNC